MRTHIIFLDFFGTTAFPDFGSFTTGAEGSFDDFDFPFTTAMPGFLEQTTGNFDLFDIATTQAIFFDNAQTTESFDFGGKKKGNLKFFKNY